MFRIKQEQMDFFAEKARVKFCKKMERYLRTEFVAVLRGMDATALASWVAAAVDKAARYKVTTEPEAAQLILLFLLMGLDADEHRWVREILANKNLYAVGKVRRLVRAAREHGVDGLDEVLVYPEMSDRPPPVDMELAAGPEAAEGTS